MGLVNSVELISTLFTSSSSVPLLEKLRRGFDPTGVLTKRRKEGTLDTENKNGSEADFAFEGKVKLDFGSFP